MAAKLLSLYLLAVAGLAVVRAAPLILDQRQDDPNGTLAQQPSDQLGPDFNVTDFPSVAVKRGAPSILDQRQDDPNGTLPQEPNNDPNGTLPQQPNNPPGTLPQQTSI